MKRHLFNLAAAVSLLLCVATVALWVQSYRAPGEFYRAYVLRQVSGSQLLQPDMNFDWASGRLGFSKFDGARVTRNIERYRVHHPSARWFWVAGDYTPTWSTHVGFGRGIIYYPRRTAVGEWLSVPFWFLVLATGALPLIWIIRHSRKRRRDARGLCHTCGYDLRHTPERCPECGKVPSGPDRRAATV